MAGPKSSSAALAVAHWNETPLRSPEEEWYLRYPWLYSAAEFQLHQGQDVLEIGCGGGTDLLQFARHGSRAFGIVHGWEIAPTVLTCLRPN